jgi:hypothetical protein
MTTTQEVSIWTSNRGHAVFVNEVRMTKWFFYAKDAQRVANGIAFIFSPEGQALIDETEKEGC